MRAAALLALAACGCGAGETEWERQLADVRAGESDAIVLVAGRVTPHDLEALRYRCEGLRRLTLCRFGRGPAVCDGDDFTGPLVASLAALPNLARLDFDGPVDLSRLSFPLGPPPVTTLNLPAVEPDWEGMVAVYVSFGGLESLRIRDPHNQAFALARACENLRHLHLLDAPLTDERLFALASLDPRLESLYLDGTRTTPAGRAELARLRPDLHLHFDGGHR